MGSIVGLILVAALLSSSSSSKGRVNIERVDVIPMVIRNGGGPIELVCIYNISDNHGLVVKWYHKTEQIYQWIPPMKPRDLGVIAGLTSYTPETINRPHSHSIINVKKAIMDMNGEYSCVVASFNSQAVSDVKNIIVYDPGESLTIELVDFNETHVNLGCVAVGARPLPHLTIIIDFIVVKDLVKKVGNVKNYYSVNRVISSLSGLTKRPTRPTVIACDMEIPGTGYRRRERLVYYPN